METNKLKSQAHSPKILFMSLKACIITQIIVDSTTHPEKQDNKKQIINKRKIIIVNIIYN